MTLRRFMGIIVIALMSLGLIGCGRTPSIRTTSQVTPDQIISVHIVSSSHLLQSYTPIDKVIGSASAAQRLYDATIALPAFPPVVIGCPDDFGVRITLTFTRGNGQTVQVSADPNGCQNVILNPHDVRRATDSYWSTLAQTLQITRDQLQPNWR